MDFFRRFINNIFKRNKLGGRTSTINTDGLLNIDQSTPQTISNDTPIFGSLTASQLISTDANKKLQSLATATYPSLTELSYVKGLSSTIQTQLNGKQATLTFGIADNNAVEIDAADVADNDYAKFTANGLEGKSYSEVKSDLNLDSVENTALSTWAGSANITTVGTLSAGNVDAAVSAASDSAAGKVELATIDETNTGTAANRAITPDGLAGSSFGKRVVQAIVFDFTTDVAVGDGKCYFHIPASLNGMNLISVHGLVITAGTTGTTDIQIHNLTDTADMLSTKLTIDSEETGSDTAAAAAVIDTTHDDVATNDVIRIDVDAVSTTAPKGLIITLEFQLP